MPRRTITVAYNTDAPRNQAWQVGVTTENSNRIVSRHRLKKNAVQKARSIKQAGDSGVVWNKNMTGSKSL